MKLTAIFLTGLVLCSSVVCAQEEKNEFSIDAQLRARVNIVMAYLVRVPTDSCLPFL